MPASATPSESIFCEFPARGYLDKYYSAASPENAAFVRSITDHIWPRAAASDTVIEVAERRGGRRERRGRALAARIHVGAGAL